MKVIKVADWLKSADKDEWMDVEGIPALTQLAKLDQAQTGVGFILMLVPTVEESVEKAENLPVRYEIRSVPVVKMRGEWYKPEDDNVADIFAAIIRMFAMQS